ncbi:MAG: DUF2207 domain-containing protein [Candidatus Krumholzibacteriota bacterium]|nr:DUF2207 domain-containing protein [Candidatus Krumholzibacteriota bacterium]
MNRKSGFPFYLTDHPDGAVGLAGRIPIVILIAVITLITCHGSSEASNKSFHHPETDITFTLLPDGSADVEEIRSFDFKGSFSWADLEKETYGQYGRYGVVFLGVWDESNGLKLNSELSSSGRSETIKWYYSASNEIKRFRIRYRITGAIQRYRDVAQFYWKAIGDRHMYIGKVNIRLIPPEKSPRLFKVFVHSQARPGKLLISDTWENAEISQDAIGADSFVEIRALLDPDIFPGAQLRQGETYQSILEDERRVTEEWRLAEEKRIEKAINSMKAIKNGLVTIGVFFIFFIAAYIWVFIRFGREPAIDYDNEYEREPPGKIPPCVLPAILSQSRPAIEKMSNGFAATLLQAARYGYMEISEEEKKVLLFTSRHLVYTLTDKGKSLLKGDDPGLSSGERPLIDFEKDVLDVVFNSAGDGTTVTSKEIEKWAAEKKGSRTKYFAFIKDRTKDLRKDFERDNHRLDDERSEKARNGWVGFSLLCGIIFAAAFFLGDRNPVFVIAGPFIFLTGALLSIPLARRSIEAAIMYNKWNAFKKFITDFSAMKEAGPSLLAMWEDYLVYAAALGVADKLLGNLKLVASEFGTTVPAAVWFHPYAAHGAGTGQLDSMAAFESLSASMSNMQNLSSALSSSSSSGGGFSGGGGGGGGGGGCGAG